MSLDVPTAFGWLDSPKGKRFPIPAPMIRSQDTWLCGLERLDLQQNIAKPKIH